MDTSSDGSPHAEHSRAGEAGPRHLINMNMTTASTAYQSTTSNMQRKRRDALDERIDELEQRLAALTAYESPSRSSTTSFETAREQISPAAPSKKALGKRKEQNYSPKKPSPVMLPQGGSRSQNSTTIHTSSRPTTSSYRPSTRRNSTAPTSQFPSTSSSSREARAPTSTRPTTSSSAHGATGPTASSSPSSRRSSSFKLDQPAASIRPAQQRRRHRRATNTTWPSITVHPDGRQALQSVRAFSDLRSEILADMRADQKRHLTSSSLPTLLFQHPTSSPLETETQTQTETQDPDEYTNHVPASNIDWTLPSTRRAEYAKIDRSRTGVRGLLRRVTPRFLRRRLDVRVGFHNDEEGKDSDAGTVRRFRMDLNGDGEDGGGEGGGGNKEGGKECGHEGKGEKVKGRWWKGVGRKVGRKMVKGKGKEEGG